MLAVRGETSRVVGEGHDDGKGVTQLIEVIAHGDHVFLTRQSSEVPVQGQYQRSTAMLLETALTPFVIDEDDSGNQVALADHALAVMGGSAGCRSTPRCWCSLLGSFRRFPSRGWCAIGNPLTSTFTSRFVQRHRPRSSVRRRPSCDWSDRGAPASPRTRSVQ